MANPSQQKSTAKKNRAGALQVNCWHGLAITSVQFSGNAFPWNESRLDSPAQSDILGSSLKSGRISMKKPIALQQRCNALAVTLLIAAAIPNATAQSTNRPGSSRRTNDPIARIRDEGLNHSQVMQTLSYLTDVIGPRLTGSPNLKRANEWTRDKMTSWGLTNAHLEAWGPFGRGWSLKRFSAQVIEPQTIPLIAAPKAWSPGFEQPLTAEVVYFDARSNSDLDKYKGKLRGAIVLSGAMRDLKPDWEPLARRLDETNLLQLANASGRSTAGGLGLIREGNFGGFQRRFSASTNSDETTTNSTPAAAGSSSENRGGPRGRFRSQSRFLSFLAKEGAARS